MDVIGTTLRHDGARWRGVVRVRDGGRVRQVTRALDAPGKREAARMLAAWAAQVAAGGVEGRSRHPGKGEAQTRPQAASQRPAGQRKAAATRGCAAPESRMTVGEYLSAFVESRGASEAVEPSTAEGYRKDARLVSSVVGRVPLGDLTTADVRLVASELASRGLSQSCVVKAHKLLRQALAAAVADGIIARSPADGVRPPRRPAPAREINALDAAGRAGLLDALDAIDAVCPARVTVAARVSLYTGLREGEVCGLRWGDVGDCALWVRRSIGVGRGGPYVKAPKSGRPRDVALPASLASSLAAWRSALGSPGPTDYVLTGSPDFMHPTTLCRNWASLSADLGLTGTAGRRVTFHDLRHTWATMAVAARVDIKTVASNLGHADAAMTLNVYASADPDAKRACADVIERAMRG